MFRSVNIPVSNDPNNPISAPVEIPFKCDGEITFVLEGGNNADVLIEVATSNTGKFLPLERLNGPRSSRSFDAPLRIVRTRRVDDFISGAVEVLLTANENLDGYVEADNEIAENEIGFHNPDNVKLETNRLLLIDVKGDDSANTRVFGVNDYEGPNQRMVEIALLRGDAVFVITPEMGSYKTFAVQSSSVNGVAYSWFHYASPGVSSVGIGQIEFAGAANPNAVIARGLIQGFARTGVGLIDVALARDLSGEVALILGEFKETIGVPIPGPFHYSSEIGINPINPDIIKLKVFNAAGALADPPVGVHFLFTLLTIRAG